jgi:hypothetical protein
MSTYYKISESNKPNNENLTIFNFVFSLLILLLLICNNFKHNDEISDLHKQTKDLTIQIDSLNTRLDLMNDHYKECAFISREDVAIGYQGYFYSKYHRNPVNPN